MYRNSRTHNNPKAKGESRDQKRLSCFQGLTSALWGTRDFPFCSLAPLFSRPRGAGSSGRELCAREQDPGARSSPPLLQTVVRRGCPTQAPLSPPPPPPRRAALWAPGRAGRAARTPPAAPLWLHSLAGTPARSDPHPARTRLAPPGSARLPDELRLAVLLGPGDLFCLVEDEQQTYGADGPPLPNRAHLGRPGRSSRPQRAPLGRRLRLRFWRLSRGAREARNNWQSRAPREPGWPAPGARGPLGCSSPPRVWGVALLASLPLALGYRALGAASPELVLLFAQDT